MEIKIYIKERIEQAIQKIGFADKKAVSVELMFGKQKGHGDITTNVAFNLASKMKKNPREIAQLLVDTMELDKDWIQKVEVGGVGFINFTLSFNYLYKTLQKILEQDKHYGFSNWGDGKKTQVEFVSANPTGPLTIGHGRQAVIGDTIARLLTATGHKVTREYYFNDAGRQMQVLGDSVRLRYKELLGETVNFPKDYYQGEYIRDIAQKALDEKGDSLKDSEDVAYFQELAKKVIFEDIEKTLVRL